MFLFVVNVILKDVTIGPNEVSKYDLTNKTAVFIFPPNSTLIIDGEEKEINNNAFSFINTNLSLEFKERTSFSFWNISIDVCKSGGYFFDSPYEIMLDGIITANSDVCFFSDREFVSDLVEIQATSTNLFSIQFFVNGSSGPKYQCKPSFQRQKLKCQYPFGQPFFFRITNPETLFFKLKYSSLSSNGNCRTVQIPSNINRSSVLNMIEECTTIQQHTQQISMKIALFILAAIAVMVVLQVSGTVNFFFWRKENHDFNEVGVSDENTPFFTSNIGDELVSTDSY